MLATIRSNKHCQHQDQIFTIRWFQQHDAPPSVQKLSNHPHLNRFVFHSIQEYEGFCQWSAQNGRRSHLPSPLRFIDRSPRHHNSQVGNLPVERFHKLPLEPLQLHSERITLVVKLFTNSRDNQSSVCNEVHASISISFPVYYENKIITWVTG